MHGLFGKKGVSEVNWINSVVRPKISGLWQKREMPGDFGSSAPRPDKWSFTKTSKPISSSFQARATTCGWEPMRG